MGDGQKKVPNTAIATILCSRGQAFLVSVGRERDMGTL